MAGVLNTATTDIEELTEITNTGLDDRDEMTTGIARLEDTQHLPSHNAVIIGYDEVECNSGSDNSGHNDKQPQRFKSRPPIGCRPCCNSSASINSDRCDN